MGYVFKAMSVYQRVPFGGKSGLIGIAKKEGLNDTYSGVFEFVGISICELNAYMIPLLISLMRSRAGGPGVYKEITFFGENYVFMRCRACSLL